MPLSLAAVIGGALVLLSATSLLLLRRRPAPVRVPAVPRAHASPRRHMRHGRAPTALLAAALTVAGADSARASEVGEGGEVPEEALHVLLSAEAGLHHGGSGVGLGMRLEHGLLGLGGRADTMFLPSEEHGATPWQKSVTLLSLMPGVSVFHAPWAHVWLLAGVDAAFTPEATWVGPSLGLQVEAVLFGPVDAELVAEVTPVPFTRVDAQAGLVAHLGALDVRGGWRRLQMNDQGHVDGVAHEDVLNGPYLGAGVHF